MTDAPRKPDSFLRRLNRLWQRWPIYAPTVRARLWQYALLMRWDRPIGALLLLWPMLWALWLAGEGRPDAGVVAVFVAGVWVMRSAGASSMITSIGMSMPSSSAPVTGRWPPGGCCRRRRWPCSPC